MSTSSSNPATQTLQCEGPFEVFKLTPGVFQADEIKRWESNFAEVLEVKDDFRALSLLFVKYLRLRLNNAIII